MIDIPINEVKDRLKVKSENGQTYIWDVVRKKYILLLPEELVRQMLLQYLIEEAGYPPSRISVEEGVTVNDKKGRYDIIIYDKQVKPWMLIECKSHQVNIDQSTADQLSGYNMTVKAPYFMLSNGINTYCYTVDDTDKKYDLLTELPKYR